MVGCNDQKQCDETWRRSLVGWLVGCKSKKKGMHVLWRRKNGGFKGQKQGYACNVKEEVGATQRAERSTARNSECVDCQCQRNTQSEPGNR